MFGVSGGKIGRNNPDHFVEHFNNNYNTLYNLSFFNWAVPLKQPVIKEMWL